MQCKFYKPLLTN